VEEKREKKKTDCKLTTGFDIRTKNLCEKKVDHILIQLVVSLTLLSIKSDTLSEPGAQLY